MSKLYNRSIKVCLAGDVPAAFLWRGRWLQIELCTRVRRLRSWMEPDPGDTYRVHVQGGGVYDLVRARGGWVLERCGIRKDVQKIGNNYLTIEQIFATINYIIV